MNHGDAEVTALIAAARKAHPRVGVSDEQFILWLDERSARGALISRAADLLLACGCCLKDPVALAILEEESMPKVTKALHRLRLSPSQIDEVKQQLRVRLFVGVANNAPKIVTYVGRASLDNWLRVIAVNVAINHVKRRQDIQLEDSEELLPTSAGDPELQYMREEYREPFKAAMRDALNGLPPQTKNLLRQHYFDALSVVDLGVLHGIHRATAARRLEQARADFLKATRRCLSERLSLSRSQFESFMRGVRSRFEVSIQSLFV